LQQAVLIAIQKQIELVDTLTGIIETINSAPIVHTQSTRLNHMLKLRTGELDKLGGVIDSLYLDWKNGDITRDEYRRMKVKFEEQAEQFRQVIHNLNEEIQTMSQGVKSDEPYLESFLKYRNISRLERGILVELVDTIYVCEGGGIKIEFNFADQHRRVIDFIENNRRELTVLENKAV
jgi:hypothetical protein